MRRLSLRRNSLSAGSRRKPIKSARRGAGQTLTALGSYWKGRKPLILCRAVVLGALLPVTHDPVTDLDIFLKLMAMDDGAFGLPIRRQRNGVRPIVPGPCRDCRIQAGARVANRSSGRGTKKRAAAVRPASDIADAIEQPILDALVVFVKSSRATKPNTSAVAFAKVFPDFADDLTEEVETSWRWREALTVSREAGPYCGSLRDVAL